MSFGKIRNKLISILKDSLLLIGDPDSVKSSIKQLKDLSLEKVLNSYDFSLRAQIRPNIAIIFELHTFIHNISQGAFKRPENAYIRVDFENDSSMTISVNVESHYRPYLESIHSDIIHLLNQFQPVFGSLFFSIKDKEKSNIKYRSFLPFDN